METFDTGTKNEGLGKRKNWCPSDWPLGFIFKVQTRGCVWVSCSMHRVVSMSICLPCTGPHSQAKLVCAVCLVGSVTPRTQALVHEDEVETTSNLISSDQTHCFRIVPKPLSLMSAYWGRKLEPCLYILYHSLSDWFCSHFTDDQSET